jgi:hypothetical protein
MHKICWTLCSSIRISYELCALAWGLATHNNTSSVLTAVAPEIRTSVGRHESRSHWVAREAYPTLGSSSWRVQLQKCVPWYSSRSLYRYFESCMCSFLFINKSKTGLYTRKCYLYSKHNIAPVSNLSVKHIEGVHYLFLTLDGGMQLILHSSHLTLRDAGTGACWIGMTQNSTFTMESVRCHALVESYSVRTRKFGPFCCCLPIVQKKKHTAVAN